MQKYKPWCVNEYIFAAFYFPKNLFSNGLLSLLILYNL